MGKQWRELSDAEKQPYIHKATTAKRKYEEEMVEYKKTEQFKQFTKRKELHDTAMAKTDEPHSSAGSELHVFSQKFLELNKSHEQQLRKLRREIGDVENESSLIRKNVTALDKKLENIQDYLYREESAQLTNEKWRKLTLQALEESKLLGKLHLNGRSTVEELVIRLEALSSSGSDSSLSVAVKQCLSAVKYS